MGIRCKQKRKFIATTNSNHSLPVAPNLLEQKFNATCPNQAWVTDITYIPTGEGWLYLAGIKDLFSCEIVGYAMGARMTQELTGQALFRAVKNKRPAAGLIHHSDRGSQYCTHDYRHYATRAEAEASIREYIEIFYHRQRRHSRLGYVAPAVFVDNFNKQQARA